MFGWVPKEEEATYMSMRHAKRLALGTGGGEEALDLKLLLEQDVELDKGGLSVASGLMSVNGGVGAECLDVQGFASRRRRGRARPQGGGG